MSELSEIFGDARVVGQVAGQAPWLGVDTVLTRCAVGDGPLTPLREARRRLHEIAGIPPWDLNRLRAGLSRRLLGDTDQTSVNELVADLNHAVSLCPMAVLVVEASEYMDLNTVAALRRALGEPEWLKLRVLLVYATIPHSGPIARLAEDLGLAQTESVPTLSLPPQAQLVLRAAAQGGAQFHVDDVARRLNWDRLAVLLALQQAVDAGEALEDAGDGTFTLTAARAASLREGVLPSLLEIWSIPEDPGSVEPSPEPTPDPESQAQQLAIAARKALDRGNTQESLALVQQALETLDPTDSRSEVRQFRVRLQLELAHASWRSSGEGSTLTQALAIADKARDELGPDDPAELVASVLTLGAGIRYDLGEAGMLSDALDQLVEASLGLQQAGQPVMAASLLNDQAAVWIRLGDPVRASHLLRKSREVFSESAKRDPDNRLAKVELAETEHLLARLPFHVASRPGQERDALVAALRAAETSEQLYRSLPDPWSAARVLETQGRLLERLGDLAEAMVRLGAAAEQQQAEHDGLGLARTAAGLASVLAAQGQPEAAARLLGDSIRLNLDVGTPLGLAHNRRSLELLAAQLIASPNGRQTLTEIRRRLEHAEQLVGKADLPDND